MGFKDFSKTTNESSNNVRDEKIEKIYDKYKDKNEDELLSELLKNVEKQKLDGTFNYDGLKNTIDKLSPFLTKEQNLKIKEILTKLR